MALFHKVTIDSFLFFPFPYEWILHENKGNLGSESPQSHPLSHTHILSIVFMGLSFESDDWGIQGESTSCAAASVLGKRDWERYHTMLVCVFMVVWSSFQV